MVKVSQEIGDAARDRDSYPIGVAVENINRHEMYWERVVLEHEIKEEPIAYPARPCSRRKRIVPVSWTQARVLIPLCGVSLANGIIPHKRSAATD